MHDERHARHARCDETRRDGHPVVGVDEIDVDLARDRADAFCVPRDLDQQLRTVATAEGRDLAQPSRLLQITRPSEPQGFGDPLAEVQPGLRRARQTPQPPASDPRQCLPRLDRHRPVVESTVGSERVRLVAHRATLQGHEAHPVHVLVAVGTRHHEGQLGAGLRRASGQATAGCSQAARDVGRELPAEHQDLHARTSSIRRRARETSATLLAMAGVSAAWWGASPS